MSRMGMPRMTNGITSGAKKNQLCPVNESSLWPPTAMVELAMSSPRSRAPESPMKILAGCRFHGRKPRQTPTTITASNGPMFPGSSAPTRWSLMP